MERRIGETPPRTWGRHLFNAVYKNLCGNTPTHVGKTIFVNIFSKTF